jgi:hypothetical protein
LGHGKYKRVLLPVIIVLFAVLFTACNNSKISFSEIKLPKSHFHHTNGTWWGYNKPKLVRYGETVYTYYINNKNLENGSPHKDNLSEVIILRINKGLTVDEIDKLYS